MPNLLKLYFSELIFVASYKSVKMLDIFAASTHNAEDRCWKRPIHEAFRVTPKCRRFE